MVSTPQLQTATTTASALPAAAEAIEGCRKHLLEADTESEQKDQPPAKEPHCCVLKHPDDKGDAAAQGDDNKDNVTDLLSDGLMSDDHTSNTDGRKEKETLNPKTELSMWHQIAERLKLTIHTLRMIAAIMDSANLHLLPSHSGGQI
ncbi:hypothetical protein NUW54_g881 [Trametes sanguinea]|uniref:Uncharacterized protein n=1 Tax=Trametes sanguinea TaxID=158606 RepID=A0ACC1QB20_9APHY|nr:hypothetical protein NUW54_g881 [Trametes sanguinea]